MKQAIFRMMGKLSERTLGHSWEIVCKPHRM